MMVEINDRHDTLIYFKSFCVKGCFNSYFFVEVYMISTFFYWSGINLFIHTLWTILSRDKNRCKMFQMTVIDLNTL